ncbi:MAG: helix-turn-helix transcriptional regulator [Pirellulaceae bacterium]|nr:helix-turn-helix transcriptional regulator [Pirellulaceae bacterium]
MSGFRIQGDRLRRYRIQAMLTQEQLAQLADCSDRVVRKAEAGGSLRFETIELLAASLSGRGVAVTADDLIGDNLMLARQFIGAFDRHGTCLLQHFNCLAKGFQLIVAGSRDRIPFAGAWRGAKGLQQYLDQFYAVCSRRAGRIRPSFLEADNQVVSHFVDTWQLGNERLAEMWVIVHFTYRSGQIVGIQLRYDTEPVCQALARQQLRMKAL